MVEITITQAAAQLAEATDLMEGANGRIVAHENALLSKYNTILSTSIVSVFVDQQNGIDTNDGTVDSPLKSIDAALVLTPFGGHCTAILKGPYHFYDDVAVIGKNLMLRSDGSVRHELTLERLELSSGGTLYRHSGGLSYHFNSSITFYGLTLTFPVIDGTWGARVILPTKSSFVRPLSSGKEGSKRIAFIYCNLNRPLLPFCPLVYLAAPCAMEIAATVEIDQPMLGHYDYRYVNTGGTDVVSIPGLFCNLTQI